MRELTDNEFYAIREYIKTNYGISLSDEKKSLIYSRLRSELGAKGFTNFTEYFSYLTSDKSGEAVVKFIDRVTTNHTFFMREADHFEYLRDVVLPYIESEYGREKDLRLWCAASSSGEEPYTLQMIVNDYFEKKQAWNLETLATDISTKVLTKAAAGVYSKESLKDIPKEWLNKYFRRSGDSFAVKDELKRNVFFRKFNLMEEKMPFKKSFQVIFCRNVMIYFDKQTEEALVRRFASVLEPGGYLFVGHSETLSSSIQEFKYIKPAIYKRV